MENKDVFSDIPPQVPVLGLVGQPEHTIKVLLYLLFGFVMVIDIELGLDDGIVDLIGAQGDGLVGVERLRRFRHD
jgi:hypothetical protein